MNELIDALRICSSQPCCDNCPRYDKDHAQETNDCCVNLLTDAADAIEAAERLLDQNTQRCEALRKQLRESHESYERHIAEQQEQIAKLYILLNNRINEIAELEAQMPKRGEWIEKWRFKTDGTPFHKIGDMECSVCHGDMLGRFYSKYCPHCGALLRGENDEQIH